MLRHGHGAPPAQEEHRHDPGGCPNDDPLQSPLPRGQGLGLELCLTLACAEVLLQSIQAGRQSPPLRSDPGVVRDLNIAVLLDYSVDAGAGLLQPPRLQQGAAVADL